MKYKFILILFVLGSLQIEAQQSKAALFLGNSYTYVNDLPLLVKNIAQSKGDTFTYDQNTPGGQSLEGHASNPVSLAKIKSQNWDYVILQDQSQKPAFDSAYVAQFVFPFATALADSVTTNDTCSIPLYFMTWGRENGDQQNCPNFPPVCTYVGMQNQLRGSYIQMAQQNNAQVAPVGVAWKTVRATNGGINLYGGDGSHPSILGSYLAACTFYASIFHESPIGSWKPTNIDSTTAHFLQTHANNTVFDSLNVWQIDTLYPVPSVSFIISVGMGNHCLVQFDATSTQYADSIFWDFNDGGFASGFTPTHVYAAGSHSVTLELWYGCNSTIYNFPLVINCNISIDEYDKQFSVYPNPAQNILFVEALNGSRSLVYSILNTNGQVVFTDKLNEDKIDISFLSNGMYYLKLEREGKVFYMKFVKS